MTAILFDLDGTLLDTSPGIKASLQHTIEVFNLPSLSDSQLASFIGPPIQNSLASHFGLDKTTAERAAAFFRQYYSEHTLFQAVPYVGILQTLRELTDLGLPMGVATYKREDYAIPLLHHFGIDQFCPVMHGADLDGKLGKADIVERCLEEINTPRDNTFLVGDTIHDAQGAQNAKIQFIAVTWGFGFHSASDLANVPCHAVASSPSELKTIIVDSLQE